MVKHIHTLSSLFDLATSATADVATPLQQTRDTRMSPLSTSNRHVVDSKMKRALQTFAQH
jgi:hypothetical protein